MPFIDLNTDPVHFSKEDFDYVIIGAGAAGILLSVKLQEKGKRILLIESGHFKEDEERQVLNEVKQTGKVLVNAVWGRKRAVGGTTIAWGGQSLPFSPLDFLKREWVLESGWPIDYDILKPYYGLANRFMNVDEYDYDDDIFKLLKMKKQPFDEQLITYHFSKWAPEPDFSKLYKKELENKITVVYNAVVTNINVAAEGGATSVDVKNFAGDAYTVDVQQLLVATGAIEATRLLLASNRQMPAGLGNQSGWLGKGFMEHPCIEIGYVKDANNYKLQSAFNTHIYKKRKYSLRMSLSPDAQQKHHLLNVSAGIMFHYPDGQYDPYSQIRAFLETKKLSSLLQVIKNSKAYTLSAHALLVNKLFYKHEAQARVVMMLEQEPLKDSCIELADEVDVAGMRKVKLNWNISHKTWDTVLTMSGIMKDELKRMQLGNLILHDYVNDGNTDWQEYLSDVNHHMGGARMGSTRTAGVVDENLKVWGHNNIYVCSTAVFPTVSHSNPTLTLMALCIRLVDKLTHQAQ